MAAEPSTPRCDAVPPGDAHAPGGGERDRQRERDELGAEREKERGVVAAEAVAAARRAAVLLRGCDEEADPCNSRRVPAVVGAMKVANARAKSETPRLPALLHTRANYCGWLAGILRGAWAAGVASRTPGARTSRDLCATHRTRT
eukprot:357708-Chlamydomonas_euryale.AAC.7